MGYNPPKYGIGASPIPTLYGQNGSTAAPGDIGRTPYLVPRAPHDPSLSAHAGVVVPHPQVVAALNKKTKKSPKQQIADTKKQVGVPDKPGDVGLEDFDPNSVNQAPYDYKPDPKTSFYTSVIDRILKQAMASLGNPASKAVLNVNDMTSNLVDPESYANSGANALYDANIAALQRRLDNVDPQKEQDLKDIGDWFGQLSDTNSSNLDATRKDVASNVAELGDSAKGFLSAIGGAANEGSGAIGSAATLGEAGLRSTGQVDENFLNNLGTIIGLNKTQALANEKTRAGNEKADLAAQIADMNKSKGDTFNQLFSQAGEQRFNDLMGLNNQRFNELNALDQAKSSKLANIQNMALGAALAKGQITAQDLANVGSTYDIGAKAQGLQTAPVQLQANIAQIKSNIESAQAAINAKTGSQGWNLQVPSQRAALQQALRSGGVVGPQGGLAMNPEAAWNSILIGLDSAGLSGRPEALSIAKSVLQQALIASHNHGQFTNYHINSKGQLVKGNKPQLKKK